jgi:hypothetical protein
MCGGYHDCVTQRVFDKTRLFRLLEVWKGACASSARPPRKSDLDPIDLGRAGLMPYLWIMEKVGDGDFRFRLTGEQARKNFRSNPIGKRLEDLHDEKTVRNRKALLEKVIGEGNAAYSLGSTIIDGHPIFLTDRLVLPLTDDSGATRYSIGAFEDVKLRHGLIDGGYPIYEFKDLVFTPASHLAQSLCPLHFLQSGSDLGKRSFDFSAIEAAVGDDCAYVASIHCNSTVQANSAIQVAAAG